MSIPAGTAVPPRQLLYNFRALLAEKQSNADAAGGYPRQEGADAARTSETHLPTFSEVGISLRSRPPCELARQHAAYIQPLRATLISGSRNKIVTVLRQPFPRFRRHTLFSPFVFLRRKRRSWIRASTRLSGRSGGTSSSGARPAAPAGGSCGSSSSSKGAPARCVGLLLSTGTSPRPAPLHLARSASDSPSFTRRCRRPPSQGTDRLMSSQGAVAMVLGLRQRFYLRKNEVIVGRSTDDVKVDVDLSLAGAR